MRIYGHWGLSLLFGSVIVLVFPVAYAIPVAAMLLIMTPLPNKETAVSLLGRRGFTHTVLFAILTMLVTGGITYGIFRLLEAAFYGVAGVRFSIIRPATYGALIGIGSGLGVLSHILGDALTYGESKPAVRPFWPVLFYPVRLRVRSYHHPAMNDGLFKFATVLMLAVLVYRLGLRPVFLF